MNMIAKTLIAASVAFSAALATANTAVNQQAISTPVMTVKQALAAKDDTKVQVKGYVVKASLAMKNTNSVMQQAA